MTRTRALFFSLCTLFVLSFVVPFSSAATLPANIQSSVEQQDSRYQRMADNFFVMYDPSTAMDVPYKNTGLTRIEAQKEILEKSNATLPELGWQAGLYPHWKGGLWLHGSPMAFKPYYPTHRYDNQAFDAAIQELPVRPQSPPMLQTGLMKLEHLLGLPGLTEVFIFSDGQDSTFEPLEPMPLEQAKKLDKMFNICFTIISSATEPEGQQLLNQIGSINSCSQVIDFDTVYDNPEHLFGKLYMDADNTFKNILFDFDKSNVKPKYHKELNTLGQFLTDHPAAYVVLSGFTDSIGTEIYNIGLSKRRAQSVQRYLQQRFNLSKNRILLYWYGYANPVASNATREGRQLNRRVTITLRKK